MSLSPDTARIRHPSSPILLLAAAVALTLRLAFALGYWVGQPLTRDEREYLSLARSVAAGQGFVYDEAMRGGTVDQFGRAPGYPVFLALVGGGRDVAGAVPVSVKVAQSVVGALGVVMVGLLAGKLAGPRAATWAAFIAACYPPLVWIAAYALSEAIAWPLGLLMVWVFDRTLVRAAPQAPRGPLARAGPAPLWLPLACGALAGAVVLVRPATIFFLLLAAAWLLWRRSLALVGALTVGVVLVVAPWSIRNYRQYGRFVLVASEGGVTFWTGNHPLARGEGDLAANPDLKRDSQALRKRHPGLSEEAMEPVYYREALSWIRAHPADWLLLELRKVFYLAVPIGPSYSVHSARYYATSVASYVLVLPFALAGLWRLGLRRRRAPGLWLLFGSAVAASLVFFPQERFRIPVIDPTLAICAGVFWGERRQPPERS